MKEGKKKKKERRGQGACRFSRACCKFMGWGKALNTLQAKLIGKGPMHFGLTETHHSINTLLFSCHVLLQNLYSLFVKVVALLKSHRSGP